MLQSKLHLVICKSKSTTNERYSVPEKTLYTGVGVLRVIQLTMVPSLKPFVLQISLCLLLHYKLYL